MDNRIARCVLDAASQFGPWANGKSDWDTNQPATSCGDRWLNMCGSQIGGRNCSPAEETLSCDVMGTGDAVGVPKIWLSLSLLWRYGNQTSDSQVRFPFCCPCSKTCSYRGIAALVLRLQTRTVNAPEICRVSLSGGTKEM